MRPRLTILAFVSALLALHGAAQQSQSNQSQSNPDQSQNPPPASTSSQPPQNQPAPESPPAKKHSTADDNPFPEDISRKAAVPDDNAPDAPSSDKPPTSADKPPAPGDKAAAPAKKPDADYSSSRSKFENIDVMGDNSAVSNGNGGYVINLTLAAKDDKVGQYYLQTGDYKGAYDRYKEATEVNPADADAVFGLAEAARGLKRKDEAVQNYKLYLDVVPDGGKAKAARKALAELGAGPKK
jgi:tetratricopeptide (TPR) repeat protein